MRRRKVSLGRWKNRPGKIILQWRDLRGRRRTHEFPDSRQGQHEAIQTQAKIENDLYLEIIGPDDRTTFGQLADRWLDVMSRSVRRPTYKFYSSQLRHNILPAWKDKPLAQIRTPTVVDLMSDLLKRLSKGSVEGALSTARAIFRWGKMGGYLTHDPCEGVAKMLHLGKRTKSRRPLTEDEVGRFLKAAEQVAPDFLLHFHALLETGVRLGELLAIRDEHIDPDKRTISIVDQVYDDGTLEAPKSEKGRRTIRVSAQFMRLIVETYAQRRAEGTISPWLLQPEFALPEPTKRQSLRARRKLHAATKAVAKVALLPASLSPHWLRHTYATDLLGHGEQLARVSQAMGHSTQAITLQFYSEAIPKPFSTAEDEAAARRKAAMERADLKRATKFRVAKIAAGA